MNNASHRNEYTVLANEPAAPGVRTIIFRPESIPVPMYRAGQFITVYCPGHIEGKSYSLTSMAHDASMSLTVKAIGEFSNMLCALQPGEHFFGSDPYGYFYSEEPETNLVMIGAGIGSVPYRAMIKEYLALEPHRLLHLIRSNKTIEDIVFREELQQLAALHESLKVTDFITRQTELPSGYKKGRMTAKDVIDVTSSHGHTEFLICGSIAFTRDLWKGLRDAGIPEHCLYTEAFFS